MTTTNDQIIIDKVLKGNTNAFADLVNLYKDLVFSLALKMTKNREEAEEVSQDTFVKAFKNLSKFKGESKFSTWLYKIAYHACLDRFKKNVNLYKTDSIDSNVIHIQSVDDTLQSIERKERAQIMDNCLMQLPDEERTILYFFYYQELSLKEIMEITNFSEANIKVKLHRARKRLLTIVKNKFEPEMIQHYGKK